MSRKRRYISRLEHILISGLAGMLAVSFVGHLLSELVTSYNYTAFREQADLYKKATGMSVIDFGNPAFYTPRYHFISLVVFLAVVFGRKFYSASVLALAYVGVLLNAVHWRIDNAGLIDPAIAPVHRYIVAAWYWLVTIPSDLFGLAILLPLFVWELTILFRVVRQTLKSPKLT